MTAVLTVTLNPALDYSAEAERVRPTQKTRTGPPRWDPGGGGINAARVVTTMGGSAAALYLAGGETGAMLTRLLNAEGVTCRPVPSAGLTRVSVAVRERATGAEYRFTPAGPEVTAAEIEAVHDAIAASGAGYLVLSGSLPRGAPAGTWAALAAEGRAAGRRVVLDTSGAALEQALAHGRPFLVKPNLRELSDLAGRALGAEEAAEEARRLVADGAAEHVAVSMGEEGALLAGAEGVMRRPAIPIAAASSVGAGDSFVGALTWALAAGHGMATAFGYAMAAGAATLLTPGTELCRRADVEALFAGARAGAAAGGGG
jgi:6-phosphofructokinase 2